MKRKTKKQIRKALKPLQEKCKEAIEALKKIDVNDLVKMVSPKHGEWIGDRCSICFMHSGNYPYCPHCGAKMKVEEGAEE